MYFEVDVADAVGASIGLLDTDGAHCRSDCGQVALLVCAVLPRHTMMLIDRSGRYLAAMQYSWTRVLGAVEATSDNVVYVTCNGRLV